MWECEECGVENDLDPDTEEEQYVTCLECGAEYKVLTLEPLELELMEVDDSVGVGAEDDDEDDDWGDDD